MVKNPPYNAGDAGSIPEQGTKTPHASVPKKPKMLSRRNIVTNSIKTLKMIHVKKKS